MRLGIAMTLLTLALMGGYGFFHGSPVHKHFGMLLAVLWTVHAVLNRRWFKTLFRGKWSPARLLRTIVDCGLVVCALFLAASGASLLDRFVLGGIGLGPGSARTVHMLASHWYFVFVSLHVGLHANAILARLRLSPKSRGALVALRTAVCLVGAYGVWAFAARGIWKYLTLRQPFFFLDLERGYALFFADYFAMLVLFAAAAHCALKLCAKWRSEGADR